MAEFPREDRIMVRIIDLDSRHVLAPRIEPLARIGLTAADIEYIIKCWDEGKPAEIGPFRYERVQS